MPKEHRWCCYFDRKFHVRRVYPNPLPEKRMLDQEMKDACRNTGNLLKGHHKGMVCSWKKIK